MLSLMLPLVLTGLSTTPPTTSAPSRREVLIHSVCDLSQQFSFYMDGRFHRQYLEQAGDGVRTRDARNWGSLSRLDLSNANLLVVTGGDVRLPYSEASIQHVLAWVSGGGTLLVMADGGNPMPPAQALVQEVGASLTPTRFEPPLGGAGEEVTHRSGTVLSLTGGWTVVVEDARERPVLAHRALDEGHVLVGSRGLFGQRPDASDPINASWVTPLLVELAGGMAVDPERPHRSTWAEHERAVGPLTVEYTDGTAPWVDAIREEYELVRPHLVALTGVWPSEGMIRRLLILPTGGGGFSSGARIAIGAWWGNYPERRYPMVELIAHEAGHSWVLPHPEPLWNEPIATYLGIRVGERLEMPEARETLERQLERGRKHDPDFDRIDPQGEGAPRDLVWGKSYFVFEELERKHGPGALARYFQTKRELVPEDAAAYTMDDCVAVWSAALGEDMFPWFRSLAFDVDRERSSIGR